MELPKNVRLMGIIYDVVEVERLLDDNNIDKLNGQIDYGQTLISIEKSLSEQKKAATLWHEIIHGLLELGQIEHEEKLVRFLGNAICGFIQDNPELIKYHGRSDN